MPDAIFFDLDGTLLDTAPDLTAAMNEVLRELARPTLTSAQLIPFISAGTEGMLKGALHLTSSDPNYPLYKKKFLDYYAALPEHHTVMFPGISEILQQLQIQNVPWGIVTNKQHHLAKLHIARFALLADNPCLIGGDTASKAKPHPEPLWAACKILNVEPARSIFIGDAHVDILAGKAAGMKTIAVRYGYHSPQDPIEHWQADAIVSTPQELMTHLQYEQ